MKLYQVRKGQFVYYKNKLHRVYGVKPMYKKSVHLIRLSDLTQHLATAAEVDKHKPTELDSFVYNHKPYTLRKDRTAQAGDTILITNPTPDSLDHYSLNDIEVVETVDHKGVITTNSNGIKHHEYMLVVPGRSPDSRVIDYQNIEPDEEEAAGANATNLNAGNPEQDQLPNLGDVYKQKDHDASLESMVVAIQNQTVFLGGGFVVPREELLNGEKWEFLYNLLDQ
ncbi:hypothetical protein [Paenibacillus nanensis]|uniref:hypothetical protein n=1 Tax=Paenibacillus nanensis TaxID=393251 RepID=UPI0013C2C5E4|nr:hypothetical protein [Paenibacillus nanensis]